MFLSDYFSRIPSSCFLFACLTHNEVQLPQLYLISLRTLILGFPGGAVVKNLPCNAWDTGFISSLERSHMLQGNSTQVPQ